MMEKTVTLNGKEVRVSINGGSGTSEPRYENPQEEAINKALIAYRYRKAPDNQFAVFNNEQLEQLVRGKPITIEKLVQIKGFPKDGKRVENYGQEIIDIIKGCLKVIKTGDMGTLDLFGKKE
jgi:ribonuclease D